MKLASVSSILLVCFFSRMTLATPPAAICQSQRDFVSQIIHLCELKTSSKNFSSLMASLTKRIKSDKLVLIGEGHLEGGRSTDFYRRILAEFFSGTSDKKSRDCLYLEIEPNGVFPHFENCLSGKDRSEGCEDFIAAYPLFLEIRNAKKKRDFQIKLVDSDKADWHEKIPDSLNQVYYRNKVMAQNIISNTLRGDCQKGLWIGGASHLTGGSQKEKSIKTYVLDSGLFQSLTSIQILTTQAGVLENLPVNMTDNRWHPEHDGQSCENSMPMMKNNCVIEKKDIPGKNRVLFPTGLGDGNKEPFGDWNDFDYSVVLNKI